MCTHIVDQTLQNIHKRINDVKPSTNHTENTADENIIPQKDDLLAELPCDCCVERVIGFFLSTALYEYTSNLPLL